MRRVRHGAQRLQLPVADQERAFIRRQIAMGRQAGDQGRARRGVRRPACSRSAERAGFDLAAYLVPDRCSALLARRRPRRRGAAAGAAGRRRPRPPPASRSTERGRAPARRRARRLRPPVSGGVDTTVFAAFAVGFVSFISPCVLPLVPGYLSAVSGVTMGELAARRALRACCCPRSSSASRSRSCSSRSGMTATEPRLDAAGLRGTLDKIAGAVIIALGLLFVLTPFVPRLNREWRPDALISRAGSGGPLIAGAAFAFAWTPCVGPTLGAILTAASVTGHGRRGRAAAGLLLRRPRGAVHAHRHRLQPRDDGLPLAARPLDDRHRRLGRRADRRWACCCSPAS